MKQYYRAFFGLMLGTLVMDASIRADDHSAERAELKARIEQLRAEAKELLAHGEQDASSDRMKMVRELTRKLNSLSSAPAKPDEHLAAERLADERRVEKELVRMVERLECMRVAAKNLKKAEMHELAVQVQQRADELETKVQAEKERFANASRDLLLSRRDPAREEWFVERRAGEGAKDVEPARAGELAAWEQDVMLAVRDQMQALQELRETQETLRKELKEMARRMERLEIDAARNRSGR